MIAACGEEWRQGQGEDTLRYGRGGSSVKEEARSHSLGASLIGSPRMRRGVSTRRLFPNPQSCPQHSCDCDTVVAQFSLFIVHSHRV